MPTAPAAPELDPEDDDGSGTVMTSAKRRLEENQGYTGDKKPNWARSKKSLDTLNTILPGFIERVNSLEDNPEGKEAYLEALTAGANSVRGENLFDLRPEIANWLNERRHPPNPRLLPKSRSNRGLSHDDVGELLCILEYDWNNLEVRAKIRQQHTSHLLRASCYYRVLYSSEKGDPLKPWEGYLMSSLLVRTYKFLFVSPISANVELVQESSDLKEMVIILPSKSLSKSSRTRKSNSKLPRKQVTSRSIAYAAVMLIFNLTDAEQWGDIENNAIDFPTLYYFIVDFFDDPINEQLCEHTRQLLRWWNLQIFGNEHGSGSSQVGPNLASQREKLAQL
ncbi:hypothetical protein H0H92_009095, partial [Tricholoma furcatifolium]